MEHTAGYKCKQHEDSKLCNATRFESISQSLKLADKTYVLEHCYAAKQHLVHSIPGPYKGHLETGILKQRPTLDTTRSNQYQVQAQVDNVTSYFTPLARDNIAELYDHHRFDSAAECLEFIDSLVADCKYPSPVAERVDGGVRGPYPRQRELKAANEWPTSTLAPGGSNPGDYLDQI
jgi:hypothetical protein